MRCRNAELVVLAVLRHAILLEAPTGWRHRWLISCRGTDLLLRRLGGVMLECRRRRAADTRDHQLEGRTAAAIDQFDAAAVGGDQLVRDGEAEAGAALARRALEGLEQVLARLLGTPGPSSRDLDRRRGAPSRRRDGDADLPLRRLAARSIACTALRTRLVNTRNSGRGRHRRAGRRSMSTCQSMTSSRGRPSPSPTSSTSGRSANSSRRGVGLLGAAERSVSLQKLMARSSEAISFGAKRCTVGSGMVVEAVGEQLRVGQHVAQVVVDLADREAERGQPVLLLQRLRQLPLHVRQLALGGADLVAPRAIGTMMRLVSSGFRLKLQHVAG